MGQIILYTSSECDRCKTVKGMLDRHLVHYIEITDKQIMLEKDFEGVPVIEVDGKIIDNYISVLAWLEKNGYYSIEVNGDESN